VGALAKAIEESLRTTPHRTAFLAEFACNVSHAFRDLYVRAGRTPADSAQLLYLANEFLIVVSKQLVQEQGHSTVGYPDDAFGCVLEDGAQHGQFEPYVESALKRAAASARELADRLAADATKTAQSI
jgi:hypothetical protein